MFVLKEPAFVVRKIRTQKNQIFLTFDDGPSVPSTKSVLELLMKHNVRASFFVIGLHAQNEKQILKDILSAGHVVLSHSSDHNYLNYFKGLKSTIHWLDGSVNELNQLTEQKRWAFRPPAGVLTPPLLKAALKLKMPIILWSQRFFDGVFSLKKKQIKGKLSSIASGDIILLHDKQRPENIQEFLNSLEYLIVELKKQNFELSVLSDDDIHLSCQFS